MLNFLKFLFSAQWPLIQNAVLIIISPPFFNALHSFVILLSAQESLKHSCTQRTSNRLLKFPFHTFSDVAKIGFGRGHGQRYLSWRRETFFYLMLWIEASYLRLTLGSPCKTRQEWEGQNDWNDVQCWNILLFICLRCCFLVLQISQTNWTREGIASLSFTSETGFPSSLFSPKVGFKGG